MSGKEDNRPVVNVRLRGAGDDVGLCLIVWLIWAGYAGRAWDTTVNHVTCMVDNRDYSVCLEEKRLADLTATVGDSINTADERDSIVKEHKRPVVE